MLAEFFHNRDGRMPSFIDSVEDYPHLKIVRLKSHLDMSSIGEMNYFLKKAGKKGKVLNKSVLLDLRKVDHVDTSAVATLLEIFTDLKQKKYRLGIMNAPKALKEMFGILRLGDTFPVFESEKKAFQEILAWSEDWNQCSAKARFC